MNDPLSTRDGELLSAYLSGELGEDEARALEARLAQEPELAVRLEATRAVLEGLARLDAVEPPPGFRDRLAERLREERAADGADEAPASLADARERRRERQRQRWPMLGAVAAGVVGFALLAVVAVIGFTGGADLADDAEVADEAEVAEPMPEADDDAAPMETLEGLAEDAPAAPEDRVALAEPLIVETGAELDDADATRAHLAGSPAVGLVGLPAGEADELAAAFAVAVRRAPAFADAGEPAACLETVTGDGEQVVVPAHVEGIVHDGGPALAYVTVTAPEGAEALERVEAWVVEAEGCAARLFVDLTPPR